MHYPVLLQESIKLLDIKANGTYIDGTFGRGGHSQVILSKLSATGKLIAFDKDMEAVNYAKAQHLEDSRFTIIHDSFANAKEQLAIANIQSIDGILLDLGVSSPQLDTPMRGFSFKFDTQLDMRMDNTQGVTARQWLNTASEEQIAHILFTYGEEKQSRKIAKAIIAKRQQNNITSSKELVDIITSIVPFSKNKTHPATQSFQAIRIFINKELEDLDNAIMTLPHLLNSSGRLVVISFHSLEDRIVKQRFNSLTKPTPVPRWSQELPSEVEFKLIAKKVKASLVEVQQNPRSRSAVMRAIERL